MSTMPAIETALLEAIRRDQQRARSSRGSARRAALILAVIACLGSGVAAATQLWPNVRSAVRHGASPSAPGTSLPTLGARALTSLARFRGQVVIVSFWAAWCEPCVEQAPALAAINRELHEAHIGTVVLVSAYDTEGQATATLRHEHLDVPVVTANPLEPDGRAFLHAFLGGKSPLPVTFVIDRSGRVVGYTEGRASTRTLRLLLSRAQHRL
jgi:peroxiredoxin